MLRTRLAPRTIRGTLLTLIAIALAPHLVFGIGAVVGEYRHRLDAEVRANADLARAVASAFDGFVQSVLRTQHAVGVSVAFAGRTPRDIEQELRRVKAEFPMVRDMSWMDARAEVLASTEPQLVGKSMFARQYYQDILRGAAWGVTPLMPSVIDEAPIFVIARAVLGSQGELVGIVASAVDADRLGPLLGERSGAGRVSVIDAGGTIAATQPPRPLDWNARRAASDHPMVRRALAGAEAAGTYSWPPTRQERVGALVPIRSIGWVAHASRPMQAAMAPVMQAALFTAAGLLVVAVATLAAALVLARRIAEPLRALEQHAARLAGDGSAEAPLRGPTEVRRVARALDAMADAVAKRHGDLEAANARLAEASRAAREAATAAEERRAELQALVAALPVGFAIVDARQGAIRANDLAREILGAAPGDLSGPFDESRRRFRLHRPDGTAVAGADEPVDRALRGETVRGELLRVEREGSGRCVWIAANAAPIRSADGVVHGAALAFLDVTHLRELEEERETLMQTVSHDLRTPLHAVVGHARLLQRRGDDETRRRSAAILASAGRMTRLIGDLVDAARLEAGHASLRLEPVDLAAFLAGWKERMAGALAVERVTVAAPEEVPLVLADPGRVDQILVNLVSNALKYSIPDSEVRVELTATESALRLSVTDRGPGIRADEVPRLFERYYRAASAGHEEGLGLGLFITRKLVEAHQWRIEVASEPGSGSVFTVVVPRAGTTVAAAPLESRSGPARRHAR